MTVLTQFGRRLPAPLTTVAVHLGALLVYVLLDLAAWLALADWASGLLVWIWALATGWLVFCVAPSWLVVSLLLICWGSQHRAKLPDYAARWDALLWLGPFLWLGLCSRSMRDSLVPPRSAALDADQPETMDAPAQGAARGLPAPTVPGLSRWLSPSLFALTAVCFLLPFATVSCDSASTTFTGMQLVTHTVPSGGKLDEGQDCSTYLGSCVERDASTTATVALAAALFGLLLGLLGLGRGTGWAAGVAAVALAALPLEGPFLGPTIETHPGYDLALIFSLYACGLHAIRAFRRRWPPVRESLVLTQLKAITLYALAGTIALIVSSAQPGPAKTPGTTVFAWLVFIVVPGWLGVCVLLARWNRQQRLGLSEHAVRLDALILLGPVLVFSLCSKTARKSLAPPERHRLSQHRDRGDQTTPTVDSECGPGYSVGRAGLASPRRTDVVNPDGRSPGSSRAA
jgi:hypothetical protein